METTGITMTGRQIDRVLTTLIDIITDPITQIQKPAEWMQAGAALKALLANPINAQRIFGVKDGKATTRPLAVIGQKRAEWLRSFYENEVQGNGN